MRIFSYIFSVAVMLVPSVPVRAEFLPKPAPDLSKPVHFEHYSIEPPVGDNWYVVFLKKDGITIGFKDPSFTHSFILNSKVQTLYKPMSDLNELADLVKDNLRANYLRPLFHREKRSFRDLQVVPTNELPYSCVKYTVKLNTEGATSKGTLKTDAEGFVCLHPNNELQVVDIYYSEQGLPGEENEELPRQGDKFIKSFRFK